MFAGEEAAFKEAEADLVHTVDEPAGGIVQVKKGASFLQAKKNLAPVMDVLSKIWSSVRMLIHKYSENGNNYE